MSQTGIFRRARANAPIAIAGLTLAFWGIYLVVQKSALSSDEIYHTHLIWLIRQGFTQYVDFYSNHLPLYSEALASMIPDSASPLGFVWYLKFLSIIVLLGYLMMLRPSAWPYLIMFCVFGRMLEIRPDTIGIAFFNIAWWLLLTRRSSVVVAALIASLALLFSARAAVMMVPFACLCLYLAWPRVTPLVLAGLAFVAGVATYAATDPSHFEIIIRSVYVDPLGYAGMVPLWERLFTPNRFILVALILAGLGRAIAPFRRDDERALIAVVALVSQILIVVVDPAPYGYVYCWAAVPALTYLPGSDRQRITAAGVVALALLTANLLYSVIRGSRPHEASILRLEFQSTLSNQALDRAKDADLIPMLFRRQNLASQLALREEICTRFQGRVISHFWYHPICMADSFYRWQHAVWPAYQYPQRGLEPSLVIWGIATDQPARVVGRYEVHDGYAIRRLPVGPAASP